MCMCMGRTEEIPQINSDRKTNSENSAWIRSARPAKARRKRSETHSPGRPLRAPGGALWVLECAFASP